MEGGNNKEVLDDNLEKIVRDFNEFQRMSEASRSGGTGMTLKDLIDLYITNSAEDQSAHAFNFMPCEITLDMNQIDSSGNSLDAAEGSLTYITYGDLKSHQVADQIIGTCSARTVFHSVLASFKTPCATRKNLKVKGTRKYIKRRYKQTVETKEDAVETTTFNNNGAGAFQYYLLIRQPNQ